MRAKTPRAKALPANKLPDVPAADAPLIDWAKWCAEVGRLTGAWKVFPCIPGDKSPLHKGWQAEAAWDRKTVETMWRNDPTANVGLAIQPGFLVIDGDIYKPGAEAKLERFEREHGQLSDTLEFNSARGGLHLIYATTKTFGNGKGTLPDFGDVRGHGGLIVGPGSAFEGKRYTVERLAKPVALPAKIEAMLCERSSRDRSKPDNPAPYVVVDDPGNVKAFTDWCSGKSVRTLATPNGEVAAPCIEDQGGNNTLAATGAMAHDYGISADVALMIALEHHNPRCIPPWDDEQYETHFLSGYRSATGQLGYRAPAQDHSSAFKPVPKRADAEQRDNFAELVRYFDSVLKAVGTPERKAVWFRDTSSRTLIPHVIEQWLLQDGIGFLFGESGSFKTYIAVLMALHVVTGTNFGAREGFKGYHVGAPRPAIIFAGESYQGVLQRIETAIVHGGFDRELVNANLIVVDGVYAVNSSGGLAKMADEIDAKGVKPALIVVDTYNLALEGDEDSASDNKLALRGLRALAKRYGAAVVPLDHVGLKDKKRQRGSSAKIGNSDTSILCERDGDVVTLAQTKNRDDDRIAAAFISKRVPLGFNDPKSGKAIFNRFFTAVAPMASQKPDDKITRDIEVRYILAALRSTPGRHWKITELAGEARKRGCNIKAASLRIDALGRREDKQGWARVHPALAPYFNTDHERWETPSILPPIDPAFELRDDEE